VLEFYKTFEDGTRKIAEPEPGCWINAVAPTEEERNFWLNRYIGDLLIYSTLIMSI
jgi:magnesium transporter